MIPEYGQQLPIVTASDDVERATRRRAVLAVCGRAQDAADAEHVLDVLGLDPREARDDARA